jgi:hypothetical protein
MNPVTPMECAIALWVTGALLIEAHDSLTMRVHRSVEVDLARQAEREQSADQYKSDNREQVKIQHGHLL